MTGRLSLRLAAALSLASASYGNQPTGTGTLLDLVNPLMEANSSFGLSNGNTYRAIAVPWGMNAWTPVTGELGDGWTYTYQAEKLNGIRQTHQPSPWVGDYAAFALMAETGPLRIREDERASWFSHKAEASHPYDYRVYFADYDVTADVTPATRAARFRFTFPKSDAAHILLDAYDGGLGVRIESLRRRITGYVRNNKGGVPANFPSWFVAQFEHDFTVSRTSDDNWQLTGVQIRN